MGLLYQNFMQSQYLSHKFDVIATVKSPKKDYAQFVAIMENKNFPLFVITYNIEMTQFEQIKHSKSIEDPIDRSGIARRHAQFLANTIADEGRIVKEEQKQQKGNNRIKPIWAYGVQ